ncbi:alpha/beta fold hydrolase [Kitasatospora sp. NPDC094011]|uniref:alpha/beta fold hydrolase n=1 Tax=Kitasatospora sp. NPDC094011 TaxID=3364090 RepID=UPI0038228562
MSQSTESPATTATDGFPPVLTAHTWHGYHYESRLSRSTTPRIAPVVLVGGAFQTKENWGRIEAEFLAHADVITVDLPGWGKADVLPDHHGVDFLADALCHVLDDTGLTTVNLVGSSYGSAVTHALARRHPSRVRSMALTGAMTAVPEQARSHFRRGIDFLVARRMEEFTEVTLGQLMNREALERTVDGHRIHRLLHRRLTGLGPLEAEQLMTNTQRLMAHQGLPQGAAPAMPVLVTTGEHDHFTSPAHCRDLAATCADGWFTTITGADHMLPLERGPEVSDLFIRFFTGRPLTGLAYCPDAEHLSRHTPTMVAPRTGREPAERRGGHR